MSPIPFAASAKQRLTRAKRLLKAVGKRLRRAGVVVAAVEAMFCMFRLSSLIALTATERMARSSNAAHNGAVVGSKTNVHASGVFRDKTVANSVVSVAFVVDKGDRLKGR